MFIMLASLPSMGRQGGKDTPRPAPRHRNERLHHERRGGASFARVRGVEEALRHLFHPSNDGVDAFPPNRRCGGRRVAVHSRRHGAVRYEAVRHTISYGSISLQWQRHLWDGDRHGSVGDGRISLCHRIAIAFG